MSTVESVFLEPLDVLFLRGNKLFGDPGSFGESLVPPWPSGGGGGAALAHAGRRWHRFDGRSAPARSRTPRWARPRNRAVLPSPRFTWHGVMPTG